MTVLPPDPYRILGVSKDAQIPEIRSAHRKLVLKCHPDKIQDPALKEAKQLEFQQVQQAYELLSNEVERERYDRKVEAYEHLREQQQRAKASAARATPSAPKQDPGYYHVKDASPRATTFAKSSPYGRTPPRSWEDTTSAARMYEAARFARKTASYEKEKPSKREEERRRRKEEDEWLREKDKERARDRESRKAKELKEEKERIARERDDREKAKRKEEKKKAHSDSEKKRERERKSAAAEKLRTRQIIEETSESSASSDDDDVIYEPPPSKTDRKKSSSGRKPEDIDPPSTSERTRKYSGNMENAIQYLYRSSGKAPPSFTRSQTYTEGLAKAYTMPMVPVPTPPPAPSAPFAPPPPKVNESEDTSEDEIVRRSSAHPSLRRMSHDTPRSSKEKTSSHKKSSSSRDHQPIIVEAGSPPSRTVPSLARAHTESYTRPIAVPPPAPGLTRAGTWYQQTERERERHERSRSRPTAQMLTDEEDSEDDRERRHRRSRRTQSPEPIRTHHRYAVDGSKSIPIRQKQYHEQPPRGAYKTKTAYVVPNSSKRVQRGGYTSYPREYHDEELPQQFSGVKYSAQFNEQDISYSDLPYRGSYRSDVFA
ncbi:hypothetical protein F4802DRAFT_563392 [Xylaria palmicola]|nr:hypothetical protein F4802DRAFT_563392 [Xylaria palmicola]